MGHDGHGPRNRFRLLSPGSRVFQAVTCSRWIVPGARDERRHLSSHIFNRFENRCSFSFARAPPRKIAKSSTMSPVV